MPEGLNLLVFRDGRRRVSGSELKSALLEQLAGLPQRTGQDDLLGGLLRAGELECAVADRGTMPAHPYMQVTDRVAQALVAADSSFDVRSIDRELAEAAVPDVVEVSPPEGFAYYALHPLAYADVLREMPGLIGRVAVIGVRTIGATLSAVTAAAARAQGLAAERITVRPEGHPYNRKAQFSLEQVEFIRQQAAQDASFLIVDEGPGLSGSTFLAVAEALAATGVPLDRITLICGRPPDFDSLRADDGPRRARKFRWVPVSSEPRRPHAAKVFVGGGRWRRHLLADHTHWPASWTAMERLKYRSADCKDGRLFKFLGFGHYGEQVLTRESQVAGEGYGPLPGRETEGFASYPWIAGRPMHAGELSGGVPARLAAYCAFRAEAFARDSCSLGALQQMADHNASVLGTDLRPRLVLERPVLADGRIQPHEWMQTPDGRMLKTDSGGHGDDHFYPGITDIAWDLAGAIVEWKMNPAQAGALLEAYRRSSGDDASARIAGFTTAYALFRCAYCHMAAEALMGSDESDRLEQAAVRYSALLSRASAQTLLLSTS